MLAQNLLLRRLSDADFASLSPALARVALAQGECLVRAGEPIAYLHFLGSGVASVVSARSDGVQVELAVIGKEGVTGTAALLGAFSAPNDTLSQVDHAYAQRIATEDMLAAMANSASLRETMLRFVQTIIVQMGNNAAANVSDRLNARLARWLLMCHDRVEGDDIAITHRFMASMIGAPRTAVTAALHALESDRLVKAQRGVVIVIDRRGLEALAGSGYGTPECEYRRLIAPFGKTQFAAT